MDFHEMKRKELQALCKKHGVPANLTNREMADRLHRLLQNQRAGPEDPISIEPSCLGASHVGSVVNAAEPPRKRLKKVRFSPENQTFFFEASVHKTVGRTRARRKSYNSFKVDDGGEIPRDDEDSAKANKNLPVRATRSRATMAAESDDISAELPVSARKRGWRRKEHKSTEEKTDASTEVVNVETDEAPGSLVMVQLRSRKVIVPESNNSVSVNGNKNSLVRATRSRAMLAAGNDDISAKLPVAAKKRGRKLKENKSAEGKTDDAGTDNVSVETDKQACGLVVMQLRSEQLVVPEGNKLVTGNENKHLPVRATRSRAMNAAESNDIGVELPVAARRRGQRRKERKSIEKKTDASAENANVKTDKTAGGLVVMQLSREVIAPEGNNFVAENAQKKRRRNATKERQPIKQNLEAKSDTRASRRKSVISQNKEAGNGAEVGFHGTEMAPVADSPRGSLTRRRQTLTVTSTSATTAGLGIREKIAEVKKGFEAFTDSTNSSVIAVVKDETHVAKKNKKLKNKRKGVTGSGGGYVYEEVVRRSSRNAPVNISDAKIGPVTEASKNQKESDERRMRDIEEEAPGSENLSPPASSTAMMTRNLDSNSSNGALECSDNSCNNKQVRRSARKASIISSGVSNDLTIKASEERAIRAVDFSCKSSNNKLVRKSGRNASAATLHVSVTPLTETSEAKRRNERRMSSIEKECNDVGVDGAEKTPGFESPSLQEKITDHSNGASKFSDKGCSNKEVGRSARIASLSSSDALVGPTKKPSGKKRGSESRLTSIEEKTPDFQSPSVLEKISDNSNGALEFAKKGYSNKQVRRSARITSVRYSDALIGPTEGASEKKGESESRITSTEEETPGIGSPSLLEKITESNKGALEFSDKSYSNNQVRTSARVAPVRSLEASIGPITRASGKKRGNEPRISIIQEETPGFESPSMPEIITDNSNGALDFSEKGYSNKQARRSARIASARFSDALIGSTKGASGKTRESESRITGKEEEIPGIESPSLMEKIKESNEGALEFSDKGYSNKQVRTSARIAYVSSSEASLGPMTRASGKKRGSEPKITIMEKETPGIESLLLPEKLTDSSNGALESSDKGYTNKQVRRSAQIASVSSSDASIGQKTRASGKKRESKSRKANREEDTPNNENLSLLKKITDSKVELAKSDCGTIAKHLDSNTSSGALDSYCKSSNNRRLRKSVHNTSASMVHAMLMTDGSSVTNEMLNSDPRSLSRFSKEFGLPDGDGKFTDKGCKTTGILNIDLVSEVDGFSSVQTESAAVLHMEVPGEDQSMKSKCDKMGSDDGKADMREGTQVILEALNMTDAKPIDEITMEDSINKDSGCTESRMNLKEKTLVSPGHTERAEESTVCTSLVFTAKTCKVNDMEIACSTNNDDKQAVPSEPAPESQGLHMEVQREDESMKSKCSKIGGYESSDDGKADIRGGTQVNLEALNLTDAKPIDEITMEDLINKASGCTESRMNLKERTLVSASHAERAEEPTVVCASLAFTAKTCEVNVMEIACSTNSDDKLAVQSEPAPESQYATQGTESAINDEACLDQIKKSDVDIEENGNDKALECPIDHSPASEGILHEFSKGAHPADDARNENESVAQTMDVTCKVSRNDMHNEDAVEHESDLHAVSVEKSYLEDGASSKCDENLVKEQLLSSSLPSKRFHLEEPQRDGNMNSPRKDGTPPVQHVRQLETPDEDDQNSLDAELVQENISGDPNKKRCEISDTELDLRTVEVMNANSSEHAITALPGICEATEKQEAVINPHFTCSETGDNRIATSPCSKNDCDGTMAQLLSHGLENKVEPCTWKAKAVSNSEVNSDKNAEQTKQDKMLEADKKQVITGNGVSLEVLESQTLVESTHNGSDDRDKKVANTKESECSEDSFSSGETGEKFFNACAVGEHVGPIPAGEPKIDGINNSSSTYEANSDMIVEEARQGKMLQVDKEQLMAGEMVYHEPDIWAQRIHLGSNDMEKQGAKAVESEWLEDRISSGETDEKFFNDHSAGEHIGPHHAEEWKVDSIGNLFALEHAPHYAKKNNSDDTIIHKSSVKHYTGSVEANELIGNDGFDIDGYDHHIGPESEDTDLGLNCNQRGGNQGNTGHNDANRTSTEKGHILLAGTEVEGQISSDVSATELENGNNDLKFVTKPSSTPVKLEFFVFTADMAVSSKKEDGIVSCQSSRSSEVGETKEMSAKHATEDHASPNVRIKDIEEISINQRISSDACEQTVNSAEINSNSDIFCRPLEIGETEYEYTEQPLDLMDDAGGINLVNGGTAQQWEEELGVVAIEKTEPKEGSFQTATSTGCNDHSVMESIGCSVYGANHFVSNETHSFHVLGHMVLLSEHSKELGSYEDFENCSSANRQMNVDCSAAPSTHRTAQEPGDTHEWPDIALMPLREDEGCGSKDRETAAASPLATGEPRAFAFGTETSQISGGADQKGMTINEDIKSSNGLGEIIEQPAGVVNLMKDTGGNDMSGSRTEVENSVGQVVPFERLDDQFQGPVHGAASEHGNGSNVGSRSKSKNACSDKFSEKVSSEGFRWPSARKPNVNRKQLSSSVTAKKNKTCFMPRMAKQLKGLEMKEKQPGNRVWSGSPTVTPKLAFWKP